MINCVIFQISYIGTKILSRGVIKKYIKYKAQFKIKKGHHLVLSHIYCNFGLDHEIIN